MPPSDLDSIRERHQALSDNAKAELRHRAEKIIHSAAGSLEAYKALPSEQYRAAMIRVLPAVFLASERASQTKCTGEVAAAAGWNQELRAKIKGAKPL